MEVINLILMFTVGWWLGYRAKENEGFSSPWFLTKGQKVILKRHRQ